MGSSILLWVALGSIVYLIIAIVVNHLPFDLMDNYQKPQYTLRAKRDAINVISLLWPIALILFVLLVIVVITFRISIFIGRLLFD